MTEVVHKPVEIVLVRHGQSEGNVINHRLKAGEDIVVPGYRERHESLLRLSPLGVEQARAAGSWVLKNVIEPADYNFRLMTSPYNRAMETAVEMGISDLWEPRLELREREWAEAAYLSPEERREAFERNEQLRQMSYYFWPPPGGGESVARMVDNRIKANLGTLYREDAGAGAIMVTHGETMWGYRVPLEKLHPLEFNEQDRDPAYHIPNCMIIRYKRQDPRSGEMLEHFEWRQAVCPWDASQSWAEGEWVNVQAGRRNVPTSQLQNWYEAYPPLEIPE